MLRKNNEKSEGVTYKPNCGIDFEINLQSKLNVNHSSYSVVYFDLETTELSMSDEILQIAAICDDREFNVYIHPTRAISSSASNITGLRSISGELYLKNQKLLCTELKDALIAFNEFLSLSKYCFNLSLIIIDIISLIRYWALLIVFQYLKSLTWTGKALVSSSYPHWLKISCKMNVQINFMKRCMMYKFKKN